MSVACLSPSFTLDPRVLYTSSGFLVDRTQWGLASDPILCWCQMLTFGGPRRCRVRCPRRSHAPAALCGLGAAFRTTSCRALSQRPSRMRCASGAPCGVERALSHPAPLGNATSRHRECHAKVPPPRPLPPVPSPVHSPVSCSPWKCRCCYF